MTGIISQKCYSLLLYLLERDFNIRIGEASDIHLFQVLFDAFPGSGWEDGFHKEWRRSVSTGQVLKGTDAVSCSFKRYNWSDDHFRGKPLNLLQSGNGQHIGAVIQDHIGSACCNNWKQKHNSFLKSFAGPLQLLRTMYWRHPEWRGNFHAPWWGQ